MYRVLVVDDEKYIRKSIINRVHWEKCRTEVVGEASDGAEGYRMTVQHHPDIIITDIRMPGMDGLALAQKIAEEYPQVKIIIISAYSDFEYARTAISYGVSEYLLKPVDGGELEAVLLRLGKELEQRETESRNAGMSVEKVLQVCWEGDSFVATVFNLRGLREEKRRSRWLAGALRTMEEQAGMLGGHTTVNLLEEDQEDQYIFLWNGDGITGREIGRLLRRSGDEIFDGEQGRVGISGRNTGGKMDEKVIRQLLAEAFSALKNKLFEKGRYLFAQETVQQPEKLSRYKNDQLLLHNLAVHEDWEQLELQIGEMIAYRLPEAESVMELEYLIGELLFVLERMAACLGYTYEIQVLFHDLKKTDALLQFDTVAELTEEMRRLAGIAFSCRTKQTCHDVLDEIRDYVQRHYMEDLSVTQLAACYHLNANYLSTVFRERNQITLSAYLEGVRMEKAKYCLRETKNNVTETALAVGYSDPNYFTKVFKKYTGMTPSQWRKMEENR